MDKIENFEDINGGVKKAVGKYIVRQELCVKCNICADFCVEKAIHINGNGVYAIDDSLCTRCGACATACPSSAIHAIR